MAQQQQRMDGSVRGRVRLFGPPPNSLNPLYNNNFLPREEREKGGGPVFPKHCPPCASPFRNDVTVYTNVMTYRQYGPRPSWQNRVFLGILAFYRLLSITYASPYFLYALGIIL